METHDTRLQAKVAARNEVNQLANIAYKPCADALLPFVGQKVCKVDGTLLQKVKDALPIIANGFYSTGHGYSLLICIKTCHANRERSSVTYGEQSVYLGELQNGILKSIIPQSNFKSDYTIEFVIEKRGLIRTLDSQLSALNSEIRDFGLHDNN